MAFCGNCGTKLEGGARFCPNCGERVAGAAQPRPVAPPVPPPPPQQSSYPAHAGQQPVQHPTGSAVGGIGVAAGGAFGGIAGGQPQTHQPPQGQADPYLASAPQQPPQYQPVQYQEAQHRTGTPGGTAGAPETPMEKIKDMFFTYRGRLNRKPFILRGFAVSIFMSILSSVMGVMSDSSSTALHIAALLMLPVILIGCVASCMLIIRRWHDLGKSGWFTLILIIPIVSFFVMLYLWFARGTVGPNAYGEDPLA